MRAGAIGFAVLFVIVAFWATWILYTKPIAMDFLSYWAASRLVLTGHLSSVYVLEAHRAVEELVAPIKTGWLPFPYPPPFLIIVIPFGLAPFWLAFFLWLTVTTLLYALAIGRKPLLPYALGHPSVLANFLIGQNGLLTTAIMAGGLRLIERRPLLAGAILGLLLIKPQLTLALPFAMLAGRQWKAIAGAVLSTSAAALVSLAAFGPSSFQGFLSMLPIYTKGIANNQWPWNELASVFAALCLMGVSQGVALLIHALIGCAALAVVCRAWWLGLEERVPVLVTGTMLVSPYVFTYDALLLALPMLWLIERGRRLWVIPVAWLFCFLPVIKYFGFYDGPNPIPLAAILILWVLSEKPEPQQSPTLTEANNRFATS